MTRPKCGDLVSVTLSGEVFEASESVDGYVWVRIPGHGPVQVPTEWVRVVKEAPPHGNNGHGGAP